MIKTNGWLVDRTPTLRMGDLEKWKKSYERVKQLKPKIVIPGHDLTFSPK